MTLHTPALRCEGFYFGCWPHILYAASWGRNDIVPTFAGQWVETKLVNTSETAVLTLTESGKAAWYSYATYCSGSFYPKLAQQAGCAWGMSQIFGMYINTGASKIAGASTMSWDLEAFVLPSGAVLAGHNDLNGWTRPTKLHESSAGGRVITGQELAQALCERITSEASFFAWLPCMFNGVTITPTVYTHSVAYDSLPYRLDEDPYVAARGDDGMSEQNSAEDQARGYGAEYWEPGVDKQLAFMIELQASSRLHGT